MQFNIQAQSEIPASKQLFDQIQFAIASRQYSPGHRLPSTRQMAVLTGLHRNTISKVYGQLERAGLVESQAGSGIYVKAAGQKKSFYPTTSPLLKQEPKALKTITKSLDDLLNLGYNLTQIKDLFATEIEWRLRCMTQVLLTAPSRDLAAGELMLRELKQALGITIALIPLEELLEILEQSTPTTVITNRYFIEEVLEVARTQSVPVIPVDIYDYEHELQIIKKLPPQSCLGLVSLSAGTLGIAETIVHSLRGNDLLIIIAQVDDKPKLKSLIKSARTIITDLPSYPLVKKAISYLENDLIRFPEVICSQNYISLNSIELLKRELNLG